jgi:hypothetical protein
MNTPILKHPFVKVAGHGAGGASARGPQHGRASARLVEAGGEVRAIEITCACGETSLVELVFDARREEGEGAT